MAPKAEKKPAKKVAKKVAGGKGKKGKSKVESFKIYIYKVLKQVRASKSPLTQSSKPWLRWPCTLAGEATFMVLGCACMCASDSTCLACTSRDAYHACFMDTFQD